MEGEVVEAEKCYNKYFIIKSATGGKPNKVTKFRDGSLLVEVANEEQSTRIVSIKKLLNTNVEVKNHPNLNQVQGIIRYRNHPKYTDEEILEDMKQQHVSNIYHIERKQNIIFESTNIYILTFHACNLPTDISIGWTKCEVR